MTAPQRLGTTVAPMSYAQERLWLIDTAAPGSSAYNVPLLTRWHEPVDVAALRAALDVVVARHEVLRTTYKLLEDQGVQVVRPTAPVAVEVIDGSARVAAEVAHRARLPFDLATGPVMRCTVWRGRPDGDLMLFVVHHIAIDGWSLPTLYAELAEAYRAAVGGGAVDLPGPALQYADFARWDRETFAETRRQRQLADRVAELLEFGESLVLAGARPAPAAPDGERTGEQRSFELSGQLWAQVHELARLLRATPFVVLHAAFQAVLRHWSDRDAFVVGAVTANRPHPDVEALIGFFVNTVPMRCQVTLDLTFAELCARTRAEAFRTLTYQWIPFDRLTAELAAARDGGHRQLVNVCFALQNWPAPRASGAPWSPPEVLPTGTAKFDLLLIVEETPAAVTGIVEYDTDRYPEEVCAGVIRDFRALLAGVVADAHRPLRTLELGEVPRRHRAVRTVPTVDHPRVLSVSAADQRHAEELFDGALGGRPGIHASANFFALGGHSLLAVTMLARASRRYGVALSPREFFSDPTVGGLARLLAGRRVGWPGTDATVGDTTPCPASSTQQRFWFLDRIPALRSAYLMPTVLEMSGPVDRDALRAAVDQVLAHHPALRSVFALDRRRRGVVYRTDAAPAVTATSDCTADSLRDHVADACWSGFDLATQAPARAEVITVEPERTLLVLVLHHIVADGWSRQVVLEQIARAYAARVTGTGPVLAVPVHPGVLARETDEAQTQDVVAWLKGAPVDVELPHDRDRPAVQATLARTVSVSLDPPLTARIRALAAGSAATTFMTSAALLAVTLAGRSAQRDFVFAFPWSGRDAGSIDAVGMLVNTLLLRVDLRGVRTWRELLGQVRDSALVSYRNADASYDVVAATLHPDRDLGRPPLTPVYLSTQDAPDEPPSFAGDVRARFLQLDPYHVKYELELVATDHADRLQLDLSYPVALFDGDTIAGLLADLVAAAGSATQGRGKVAL